MPSSYYRNDRHGLSQYQWSPHDKKPRGKTVQGLCGLPRRPPGPRLLWLPVLAFWACSFQPFVCLSVCKGGGVHSTSRCYLCDVDKNKGGRMKGKRPGQSSWSFLSGNNSFPGSSIQNTSNPGLPGRSITWQRKGVWEVMGYCSPNRVSIKEKGE